VDGLLVSVLLLPWIVGRVEVLDAARPDEMDLDNCAFGRQSSRSVDA
jgi:hypothetical protein